MFRLAPLLFLAACAEMASALVVPCPERCETVKECLARGEHVERCEMQAQECRICTRDGGR